MNGVDTELILKPLTFIDNDKTNEQQGAIKRIGFVDTNNNNIEEKVTNNEQY